VALFYYKPSSGKFFLKKLVESFVSSQNIKIKIDEINIEKKDSIYYLKINKISLNIDNQNFAELYSITIIPNIDQFFQSFKIFLEINIESFKITKSHENFDSDFLSITYSNDLSKFSKKIDIKSKLNNLDKNNSLIKSADIRCIYLGHTDKQKLQDCSIFINDISSIILKKAKLDKNIIELDGAMKDISIECYKILRPLFPNNELLKFLETNQISGKIASGEFKAQLKLPYAKSDKINNNYITANFNVNQLFFRYDDYYPPLRDVVGKLSTDGFTTKFNINSGYIGNTKIDGSIINIIWNDPDKNNRLIIDGLAKGKASDLIKFVPLAKVKNLEKNLINLNSIKGDATTKIDIVIPLNKSIKNIYNISTNVKNISFDFLKYIHLTNGKLNGIFDGKTVNLESSGTLNNCPYTMSQHFDINAKKTSLIAHLNVSKKLNSYNKIDIQSGSSVVTFNHLSEDNKSDMSLFSDLSTIEFLLHYPTIFKAINVPATLSIKANYKNNEIDFFKANLTNNKDINILGQIMIKNSNLEYDFSQIKSLHNNFKLLYKNNDKLTDIKITGEEINLSKINLDFLIPKQSKSKKSLKITSEISNARMYNDIDIKNLKINIDCHKDLCKPGKNLYGELNDKNINLDLSYVNEKEIWTFYSGNTGNLFKAINLLNAIKDGDLKIILEKDEKNGNVRGVFYLNNFIVTDPPSITKIISVASLSGFLKTLSKDKKITFTQLTGQFKKETDNLWKIFYTKCEGNFFDLILTKGEINNLDRVIKLSGLVLPHYFIGSLIKPIPILSDFSFAIRSGLSTLNPLMTFTKEIKY
jgi:hypothetical protein